MEQFEHLKIQLEAIKSATNNFADENCIGKGGFGKVYMGKISHSEGNTMVAFKRLDRAFGQGDSEFWKEIMMLSLYKHDNIVSLLGYCDDCGEMILVYQYASKRSLELYINNHELTWVRRLHICIGAARGLAYLHSAPIGTQQRLLHRDIKSSNILLDENWNAKISDFGLSKICPANQKYTFLFSHPMGTPGYCDPLYAKTGYLTKESDVYSFGVVLFEVLCGRLSIGNNIFESRPLVEVVRQCYEQNKLNEIIYGNIKYEINPDSLKVFTRIAYQCLMKKREDRPLMTYIVTALESALEYQCPKPPSVGILNVKVLRGINLERRSFVGAFNPYVVLKLIKSGFPCAKKTTVKHNDVKPEWNEEFTFYVENFDVQSLEIWVGNAVTVEMHDNLRIALLPLKDLTPEIQEARNFYIFNPRYNNRVVGNLKVEVEYIPFTNNPISTDNEDINAIPKSPVGTPEGGGLLVVIIHEGRFLQDDNHTVWLLFQGGSRKTRTMMNTRYPLWEEEFTFMLNLPPTNETLHLEVINSSSTRNESLGCVDISLADVVNNNRTINTYEVHLETRLIVELQWRTTN